MKTTRMITVTLASSALLGVFGFALVNLNLSLATVLNVAIGSFVGAGLFGILLWDTGRTIKANETIARFEQRKCDKATCTQRPALRRHTALAGC